MAGHRPSDWHVLDLDKDPTPGDPQRVRTLAKTLHDFADDVSDALRLVKGMAGESTLAEWAGKSATVFKEEFSGVPKNLTKLEKSYGMCGDALADFWPKLERAQALADKALVKAREAREDLSSAQSKLSSADSWVTRASKEADKYKDDPTGSKSDADKPDEGKVRAATRDVQHAKTAQTNAQSAVDSAQSALDAAKKMAEDARKMREDAARDAKNKIDEASDAGIQNRSWWEDVGDWFTDNWDSIVAVCKVVVAVVGIVAMIIGGPILGAIVLVAGLIVLADSLYKYSKGQASLWEVGLAALDCIPGMKGLTTLGGLAKGLKGGMAAMKGIKGGLKGMGLALRGLGKNARGMVADGAKGAYNRVRNVVRSKGSDPVDMATGAMYLPQTDVELPGILPLVFTRRVASDYRCGWWFGPTWASTIDQRLEVDAEGIILVTEDGLLLSYPHPASSEVPVLPEIGPQLPLVRLDDGSYRVDDLLTGRARHFGQPDGDGVAPISRVVDRNLHTITFDYDACGTPLAIRHSGGYHLKLTTVEGRVTALSLVGAAGSADTVIKRYGYTDGSLTETVGSSGLPLRFTYDQRLRITSWIDTNDRSYRYSYDEQDRCVAEGGAAGHIAITLDYDGTDPAWPGCRVTTLTTDEGAVTRFVTNSLSQVVAEVDALGAVTRTTYDEHHHVLSQTDSLGLTTHFENNRQGQPTRILLPDGREVRVKYNALCLPIQVIGPDGGIHRRTYDERGNQVAAIDSAGNSTSYSYDVNGRLVSATDALGNATAVHCTTAGLPVEITNPLGATTRCERDAFGRRISVTDPLGAVTRLAWTVEGLLASRTAPDGTHERWIYDGEGNCVQHIDPAGGVSSFEYTHFDLLTARTGPDGVRYEFDHDSQLRLIRVTDPRGLAWHYTYDSVGNLSSETDFDGRTLTYGYDRAGRLVSRTNALSQTIAFERNAMGQIVRKDAAGSVTTYSYGPTGHLAEAAGPDGTVTFLRDDSGRLVSETVNGRSLAYEYDELGRRTARVTPSGARTQWTFDAGGNRSEMSASGRSIGFSHDLAGRELSRRVGDEGLILAHEHDALGRLTSQAVVGPGGTSVQRRTYAYRADGHLLGVDDQLTGARRYELDPVGRVTAVHAAHWTERYAYDETGNLRSAHWPEGHPGQEAVGPREYEGTRITRAGSVRYEHDPLGRITLRQKVRLSRKPDTWRYQWDAEDRLSSVVTPDGTHWRYAYDPLGRRTAKHRLSGDGRQVLERVDFTWDGTTLCEQTTTRPGTSNAVTLTWDHQGLRPIAQTERVTIADEPQQEIDSRFFAIVTDLVGSPSELIDEQGEIAWRTRATLWGTTAWSTHSTAYTPLRFPGQYFDPETGLHYNYHRHYDPETARYLTPDPLGLAPAPNPVTYVDNPQVLADPLGLAPDYDLTDMGDGWYRSPAGLDYGPGSAEGHRILHVMEHARENPAKPRHGVYDTGSKGILETVDEAWDQRDVAVSVNQQGARSTYVIPMNRRVGLNEGEDYMSITVEHGNEVVTAFPRSWP